MARNDIYTLAGEDFDLDALMAMSGDEYIALANDDYASGDDIVGEDYDDYASSGDDIVGDDIIGALVGAAPRRRRGRQPARLIKVAKQRPPVQVQRRGFEYQQNTFKEWREAAFGFPPTVVAANATATIVQQPQQPFRMERIVIPSNIATSFDIIDFKVGKNSQFVVAGAISAVTFSELGVGVRLLGDTAGISQLMIIQVQNITAGPVTFRCSVIGKSLQ